MAIKVGDVVQHKSGGPDMTVMRVSADGATVTCGWFTSQGLHQRVAFPSATLKEKGAEKKDKVAQKLVGFGKLFGK